MCQAAIDLIATKIFRGNNIGCNGGCLFAFAMQCLVAVSHIAMIIRLGIYICCNEVQMLHYV